MKYSYHVEVRDLPLILAGPILRRTEADRVTVWLALKESSAVELQIYATEAGGKTLKQPVAIGRANTVQLGKHLHLVTVTARAVADSHLEPGLIYAYNLWFANGQLDLVAAANAKNFTSNLSYFSHQLPTFLLPAKNLEQLRLIHGSCRKPHGGGKDALTLVDKLIEEAASANHRPQQLFLTGDQIYADDVADPILWFAQGIGDLLLGWEENLPLQEGTISGNKMPPGRRSEIARIEAGFTGMLDKQPEKAKSHLFSLGEFFATYLLSWSPVLAPTLLPRGDSLFDNSKQAQAWDKEASNIQSFIDSLDKVRRALANIATYTICDDHDISDDWYLNREWCDRVLSKPLGRRVLQNGLLAYALCQAWGNSPEQFAPESAGEKLLQTAVRHSAAAGTDLDAMMQLDRYLGIPPIDPNTGLPQLERDENVWILQRDREALPWHYRLRHSQHEVIVLDTRTWRGYPEESKGIAPPMLLCPSAFEEQLELPLEFSDSLNHSGKADIKLTIVVLPTNIATLSIIDKIQRWDLNRNKVFDNDVGDSWNFNETAFANLILSLCQRRDRVIILSGDIHYSCAVRLSQWYGSAKQASILVQLTSSAFKNAELKTQIAHTRLKYLLPESTENCLVWQNPSKFVKVTWWKLMGIGQSQPLSQSLPDWQYRIEWIERRTTKLWQQSTKNKRRLNFWQRVANFITYLLWRNPWFQNGAEVVGHNNISLVRFDMSVDNEPLAVIQETYWHPPEDTATVVKCEYVVSLVSDSLPPLKTSIN